VTAVRAEQHVQSGPAVLGHASARVPGLALDLAGEQVGKELREVDREARFPVGAAVGVVFGREPVERAPELAKPPLDVGGVLVSVLAFQADRFAPAQPSAGDRDDHGEVIGAAGQQRGLLGDE
jgi:hypothetical protein